ncbi:MAG: sugar ABC transporter permease, partial [Phreatobacter sp.]
MTSSGNRTWIHAWLMLGPSLALLALFTHWPAVATVIESFYSTPRPRRPSRFVGVDNFEQMLTDPVFWQAM